MSPIHFLQIQLLEMHRLAEVSKDDVFLSLAIEKRRESLARQLANAQAEPAGNLSKTPIKAFPKRH